MSGAAAKLPQRQLEDSEHLIETGVVSLNKYGEELCGDNVVVSRRDDSVIMVLSDGLGSGVKANILSTLTTRIAGTMLEMGATLDEVVETIGRTLPICKVRDLAYSTFTIIQVFSDGRVYLAEFDNPATFYIHRGRVTPLVKTTREVAGKSIKEARFQARDGDFIVAISDGVVHAGIGAVLNLGWQWPNIARFLEKTVSKEKTASGLAQRLADICRELYANRPGDDATVAVIHLRRPRYLTVAIGPPRCKKDDPKMAHLLWAAPGRKVVCGGTTSTIIARQWGANLTVDLRNFSPESPPMGHIPGVDLVTEGIITTSGALEKLKMVVRDGKAGVNQDDEGIKEQKPTRVQDSGTKSRPEGRAGSQSPRPAFPVEAGTVEAELAGDDAVSRLARIIWESDRIHFLVGRAINPAHQNPDLPQDLALKQQVIGELAQLLIKAGKQVTTTYF